MKQFLTRRDMMRGAAVTAAGSMVMGGCQSTGSTDAKASAKAASAAPSGVPSGGGGGGGDWKLKGNINHSLCRWCFVDKHFKLPELVGHAKALGIKSIELMQPGELQMLKDAGLGCGMTSSHGFTDGMNRVENHAMCIKKIKEGIDACAAAGEAFPNVITFSGMRKGMPDDVGLENSVKGLKQVVGHAEQKKVNICVEMLNSRVTDHNMKGHPDYMADSIEWCVELCRRVGSPRMKILFDVYHVQIMQGDVIKRIRQYAEFIGHYHTAGNPGRGELDATQEINYPGVMKAIAATGYTGYVGHEFIPTRDALGGIKEAVLACDV